jgi:phenylacetyl-CoA:acceptor oxidoreductase subunit 2
MSNVREEQSSYGPAPWHQTSWDARAAGNFIGGGAGGGLLIIVALASLAQPMPGTLTLAGLALVGAGLASVWLEIGRPLRALNVFRNVRTSWMSREAVAATLLFPVGLASAAGVDACRWAVAMLALVFVYCQGRMLGAARGIPAWRVPLLPLLMVMTALAEGAGWFFVVMPWSHRGTLPLLGLLGGLVIARYSVWLACRRQWAGTLAPASAAAIEGAGRLLLIAGTLLPLALIAVFAGFERSNTPMLAALAGAAAALAGAVMKFSLVTRAGFNQGFALAQLPVRGTRQQSAAARQEGPRMNASDSPTTER